jgi:hypothetical protein
LKIKTEFYTGRYNDRIASGLFDTLRVQLLLLLKLCLRQHPVSNMFALWGIEHLVLVEYIPPRFISRLVGFAPNAFALKDFEEDLSNSVVVAVYPAAHPVFEFVLVQE